MLCNNHPREVQRRLKNLSKQDWLSAPSMILLIQSIFTFSFKVLQAGRLCESRLFQDCFSNRCRSWRSSPPGQLCRLLWLWKSGSQRGWLGQDDEGKGCLLYQIILSSIIDIILSRSMWLAQASWCRQQWSTCRVTLWSRTAALSTSAVFLHIKLNQTGKHCWCDAGTST